jgi:hypothetical protein
MPRPLPRARPPLRDRPALLSLALLPARPLGFNGVITLGDPGAGAVPAAIGGPFGFGDPAAGRVSGALGAGFELGDAHAVVGAADEEIRLGGAAVAVSGALGAEFDARVPGDDAASGVSGAVLTARFLRAGVSRERGRRVGAGG